MPGTLNQGQIVLVEGKAEVMHKLIPRRFAEWGRSQSRTQSVRPESEQVHRSKGLSFTERFCGGTRCPASCLFRRDSRVRARCYPRAHHGRARSGQGKRPQGRAQAGVHAIEDWLTVEWLPKNRARGRPPRALAEKVEERILEAARRVFVERGFEGASIDQIADVARAGKPTIYARFPGKEALFTAAIEHGVNDIHWESYVPTGATLEERLASVGRAMLQRMLTPESVARIRLSIAEARRFPDFASGVGRMARERAREPVVRLLREAVASGQPSNARCRSGDQKSADRSRPYR
jgi:AcrR family transcriptional regulator